MNSAIIVAGGSGSRMGSDLPKQLLPLAGKPVLAHTLASFDAASSIDDVIVVAPPDDVDHYRTDVLPRSGSQKASTVVPGGGERQESVAAGLAAASDDVDVVAIHDAVRPLVRPGDIDAVVDAANRAGAAVLATPVTDTVKQVENDRIVRTLDRSALWTVQTPQAFHLPLIREAHDRARAQKLSATDDTSLVEELGHEVVVVPGRRANLKITIPEDLRIAEQILQSTGPTRTGIGYDVHQLVEGRALVLGCVTIPFEKGLLGHSDADVLSHAIVDAVLGAIGAGDIGRLYPDSDTQWKDTPGDVFLRGAAGKLEERGARLVNVDAVVMAQRPKLAPYIDQMQAAIAKSLGVAPDRISVKATTTEGLGFVGAGEGIAAQAIATVVG